MGAVFERLDFRQTLPDKWYPTSNARVLLLYYMPWRQHHHDPTVGNHLQWSNYQTDKTAALVSASQVVCAEPTAATPMLPCPTQELRLVKRGLDIYFQEFRALGITVEAPYVDDDYLYIGHWNDDAVEEALGGQGVATLAVVSGVGKKGLKQAAQCAYYLMSQVRHSVLYPQGGEACGPAGKAGLAWVQGFNRINIFEDEPKVCWGTGWHELKSPQQFATWYSGVTDWHVASLTQLHMGLGGVLHLNQRVLQMQVQLHQAEQASTQKPPHALPLTTHLPPPLRCPPRVPSTPKSVEGRAAGMARRSRGNTVVQGHGGLQ